MEAARPATEAARLDALYRYAVLDTPAEPAFDDLTFLAAQICRTPIALISLVDRDRQWFKSRVGVAASGTPRAIAFCAHAILGEDLLVVPDALADARFADNPLVVGEPGIRFYAGAPLGTPDGHRLGTLCVADRVPRDLGPSERQALAALARQVVGQLELRRRLADLARSATEVAERRRAQEAAEALLDIARATSSTLDLKQVLKVVAQRTAQAVGAARCSINLWRDGQLRPVMSQFADGHVDAALWSRFRSQGARRLEEVPGNAEAIRTKRPVAIEDALASDLIAADWREAWGIRSALIVPLLRQGEVVGTLNLDRQDGPHAWTQAQVDLAMTIANQAALAAENARLYEQVRDQLDELHRTHAQLLQAGKLAAVGQLVAGVAHEVNNPLAVIAGQGQLLKLGSRDPQVVARADRIVTSAMRAARIIKELRTFARPQPGDQAPVSLADVLDHVVALREPTLRAGGVEVEREVAPDLPAVWGDAQQIEQVLLNLVLNAEQALPRSGRRRITITLAAAGGHVQAVVSDTGSGIAPEVLPRIFEPFFTTKPVGQGTGLGLSICYSIVEAHGGRIRAESPPGGGATFVVELPAHAGATPAAPPPPPPPPAPARRHRVLVIDDEEFVADTLCAMFESLGQEAVAALGGTRGWEELTRAGDGYDLVTLDLKMPDLSGPRLWERLVASQSPLVDRVVFVTGDTVDPDTQQFLERTGRPVLSKPVGLGDLAALVSISPAGC